MPDSSILLISGMCAVTDRAYKSTNRVLCEPASKEAGFPSDENWELRIEH